MFALAERPREIRRLKVIFYSHDTVGLGHVRRNVALASTLAPSADVVMITGNPEAAALPLPTHTDIVTVPTVAKDAAGGYRSRTLGAPLEQVIDILGTPTSRREVLGTDQLVLSYQRMFSFDPLEVYFDGHRRFVRSSYQR